MAVTEDSTTTDDTATPGEAELEPMDPPGEGLVEDPVKVNTADPVIKRGDLTVEQQEYLLPPEGAVPLGSGQWAMPGSAAFVPRVEGRVTDEDGGLVIEAPTAPSAERFAIPPITPTMGVFVDAGESSDLVTDGEGNLVPPGAVEPPEEGDEVDVETTSEAPVEDEEGLDVSGMTVAEVKAYVEANPDQTQAVYDAEMNGKQRATLLDWLEQEDSADSAR